MPLSRRVKGVETGRVRGKAGLVGVVVEEEDGGFCLPQVRL